MASTIGNAANTPLNQKTGTVPDVGGAMLDWFQPMDFAKVTKAVVSFQASECANVYSFRGVIQPLTGRRLMLKPEGQRAWTWLWLHADPSLTLDVDEVVTYNGVNLRVMSQKDYKLYGYVEYELVQDWTGSGPCGVPNSNAPCPLPGDPPVLDTGDCPEPIPPGPCPPGPPCITQARTTDVVLSAGSWTALPLSALTGRKSLAVQNRSGIEIVLNFDPMEPGYIGVVVPDGYERSYDISDIVILYAKPAEGAPTITVEELA